MKHGGERESARRSCFMGRTCQARGSRPAPERSLAEESVGPSPALAHVGHHEADRVEERKHFQHPGQRRRVDRGSRVREDR